MHEVLISQPVIMGSAPTWVTLLSPNKKVQEKDSLMNKEAQRCSLYECCVETFRTLAHLLRTLVVTVTSIGLNEVNKEVHTPFQVKIVFLRKKTKMDLSGLFEQAAYILSPKGFKDGTVKPVGN